MSKIEQLKNTSNNMEKIEMTLNAMKITLNRQTIILENILEELRLINLGIAKKGRKKG